MNRNDIELFVKQNGQMRFRNDGCYAWVYLDDVKYATVKGTATEATQYLTDVVWRASIFDTMKPKSIYIS